MVDFPDASGISPAAGLSNAGTASSLLPRARPKNDGGNRRCICGARTMWQSWVHARINDGNRRSNNSRSNGSSTTTTSKTNPRPTTTMSRGQRYHNRSGSRGGVSDCSRRQQHFVLGWLGRTVRSTSSNPSSCTRRQKKSICVDRAGCCCCCCCCCWAASAGRRRRS